MPQQSQSKLPPSAMERAISFFCAQAVVGTIYGASLGGSFLVAYALSIGASNVQLGWMSAIPGFCIVTQLLAPVLVERGISRKWITIYASLFSIIGWAMLVAIPYIHWNVVVDYKMPVFIGIIAIITVFGNIGANTRQSWVGDLIPERQLGSFFGKLIAYSGWIGAVLILAQGRFLDVVKGYGTAGFTWLFLFGITFLFLHTALYLPQVDVHIAPHERDSLLKRVRETIANRPLRQVLAYSLVSALGGIAGPFFTAYVLRDLHASYLAFALLTASSAVASWISSRFWGRMVDRYGSRAVLVTCTALTSPLFFAWFFVTSIPLLYLIEIPVSLLAGFIGQGSGIAGSTLIYRVTPSAGRSMQMAIYSIAVTLFAAPMPALGGYLPGWLKSLGIHADVRCTIYILGFTTLASALAARRIQEPGGRRIPELVRNLPSHILRPRAFR